MSLEEMLNSSAIVVDKHAGPTSHQISGWLRDILGMKKVGHTGTLDPMVTGVLPILLGDAVKAMPLFARMDKEYVGVMHMHKDVPDDEIRKVAEQFVGKISQRPPKKSAVARIEREREVFSFDILEVDSRDVLFRTTCEAGTYIRKLCHDIGQKIGGANMTELRRTRAGPFTEEMSVSLMNVKDLFEASNSGHEEGFRKILVPIQDAVPSSRKVYVKDSALLSVLNGAPLYVSGVEKSGCFPRGETVAMMSESGRLIAIGIAKMSSEDMSHRKKGVAVRTDRIVSRLLNP